MKKLNKQNEQGRSMVEMLGVLAIIGVLSVGGIAGYTTAMRSHRANEIVNATSMAYMLGISQNAGAGGVLMTYTPTPDGVSSITFQTNNQIEINGIEDPALCAQVKNKLGDKATECPNASPYKLTVTLGDVRTPSNPIPAPNGDCSTNGKYVCLNNEVYVCSGGKWVYDQGCDGDCYEEGTIEDSAGGCCPGP